MLTLSLMGAAYGVAAASASRIDYPVLSDTVEAGSHAAAAIAAIESWAGDTGAGDPALIPSARALRRGFAGEGALAAENTFVAVVSGRSAGAPSGAMLAALASAAADRCEADASTLDAAAASPEVLVTPKMEAALYRAQGAAFAWRALIDGALRDSPALAEQTQLESAALLEALRTVTDRQPLFLFKPGDFQVARDDLRRAAGHARALAVRVREAR